MRLSIKTYAVRYLIFVLPIVIAVWALAFYAYILDEVYDNVDDGLKNQKIEILRAVYEDPALLQITEYGVNQFIIKEIPEKAFDKKNYFENELMFMPYDDEMEPYRILTTHFYADDGKAYELKIRTSTVEEDDLLLDLATALGVLYIFIILSILLINHFVLNKALSPFQKILRHLQQYKFGEVDTYRSVDSKVKEFELLNKEVISMIERNEKIFDEQKQFIENAAHELQTPLAITANKLELIMEDESLSEDLIVQLAETKDSLRRMINLNKSLLMMSRIENMQYREVIEVNFNELTDELVQEAEDFVSFKEINLNVSTSGTFVYLCNRELARILLSNMIRNAIKYTPKKGSIVIHVDNDIWCIRNTSLGIPLPEETIFKRFKKGQQDQSSNGLGLAIVSSIIKIYPELSVKYDFYEEMHIFSIKKR